MQKEKSNIELFDLFTGVILKKLYGNFPVCENISLTEILEEALKEEMLISEELEDTIDTIIKQKNKNEIICSETFFWLRDSNIITFKAPDEKSFSSGVVMPYPVIKCTVLTAKGLEILKQTPESIVNKETLGTKLAKAVEGGAMSKISEVVGMAISGSLKFS